MPCARHLSQSIDPPCKGGRSRSSVGFSCDIVNGCGNFELYRVFSRGGEPVALTTTPRHELSPVVSTDGTRIAFVSNNLGNMDLFTMPVAGGDAEHLQVEGLQFRGRSGKVRLTMVDEMDRPTAARLYVEAADSKNYAPRGEPIFYYPLEPGGKRDALSVAVGSAEFDVPAGRLKIDCQTGMSRTYQVPEHPFWIV